MPWVSAHWRISTKTNRLRFTKDPPESAAASRWAVVKTTPLAQQRGACRSTMLRKADRLRTKETFWIT